MTNEEKAAKKAAEEAAKLAAKAPAEKTEETDEEIEADIKRLQRQLLRKQLQTAEMEQDLAAEAVDKRKQDKRSTEQKQADAQAALKSRKDMLDDNKRRCRHKQGGLGLEQTLRGDGKTSLIQVHTPIPGHRYITCCRCDGEWRSPQPSLKRTEPERYARELREFEEMWEQAGDGNNQAIDVPRFSFENQDGQPVAVDLK